jgi:lauroyl/myristoyl acyltransferase
MTSGTDTAETERAAAGARPRWHTHGLNRVAYYRLAALAARALPRPLRLAAAMLTGRVLAHAMPRERAAVSRNLARVLPAASPAARARAVDETFGRFACCFVDLLVLNRRPPDRLVGTLASVEGEEHLDRALAGGHGVILLTAHLGNWDLAGRLLAHRRRRPTHVVLSAEREAALERYLRRDEPGLSFVTRHHASSALGLWAALRREEVVAMQTDRATGERGDAAVPFFGAPAAFPLGPFVLARASGAPVVPAFCVMTDDARYRVTVEPAIQVRPGGEYQALETTVGALERVVARHPTQWFNFYDVWETAR